MTLLMPLPPGSHLKLAPVLSEHFNKVDSDTGENTKPCMCVNKQQGHQNAFYWKTYLTAAGTCLRT